MVRVERTATGSWEVLHFETRIAIHRGRGWKAKRAALRHARRVTSGHVLVVDARVGSASETPGF